MVCVVTAHIVMAQTSAELSRGCAFDIFDYIVLAYVVMAYVVMAYTCMTNTVITCMYPWLISLWPRLLLSLWESGLVM